MARMMNSVFSPSLLRSSQSKSSRPNPACRSALPTCCRWVSVMKRLLSFISPNVSSMLGVLSTAGSNLHPALRWRGFRVYGVRWDVDGWQRDARVPLAGVDRLNPPLDGADRHLVDRRYLQLPCCWWARSSVRDSLLGIPRGRVLRRRCSPHDWVNRLLV